jgi:hypothetical protein
VLREQVTIAILGVNPWVKTLIIGVDCGIPYKNISTHVSDLLSLSAGLSRFQQPTIHRLLAH